MEWVITLRLGFAGRLGGDSWHVRRQMAWSGATKTVRRSGLAWPKTVQALGQAQCSFCGGVRFSVTLGCGLLRVRGAPVDMGAQWATRGCGATCGRGLARCGHRSRSASGAVDVGLAVPQPAADDKGLGDPVEPCRSPRRMHVRLVDGGRSCRRETNGLDGGPLTWSLLCRCLACCDAGDGEATLTCAWGTGHYGAFGSAAADVDPC